MEYIVHGVALSWTRLSNFHFQGSYFSMTVLRCYLQHLRRMPCSVSEHLQLWGTHHIFRQRHLALASSASVRTSLHSLVLAKFSYLVECQSPFVPDSLQIFEERTFANAFMKHYLYVSFSTFQRRVSTLRSYRVSWGVRRGLSVFTIANVFT